VVGVIGLHDAIDALASFNDDPEAGGITREVYTPTYAAALERVAEWMRDAGREVRLDAVGNLLGRWAGSDPGDAAVLTGSHVDTTLNAGRYDGVVGVLGAIEAVRAMRRLGIRPRRSVEVVVWAGEEPRFGTGCIGSRMATGELGRDDLDRLSDRDGTSLAEALRAAGFDPDRLEDARVAPERVHALVELHIEQGAVLEARGEQIGVVTAIAAPHDLRLTLRGAATHAGATPMALRRDALAGAAEVVLALERLAREAGSAATVGTVGVMRVAPGAINVVPGEVSLDVDVRGTAGKPQMTGGLRVLGVAANVPRAGLRLRELQLSAQGDQAGAVTIDGRLRSGRGWLMLRGKSPVRPTPKEPDRLRIEGAGGEVKVAQNPFESLLRSTSQLP